MISRNILIAVLSFVFLSFFSGFSDLNAKVINFKTLNDSYSVKENSYGEDLKYIRIFKDLKWWVYVYDGSELVDVYPE